MKKKEKIPELPDKKTFRKKRKKSLLERDPMRAAGEWYHEHYVEGKGVVYPEDDEEDERF